MDYILPVSEARARLPQLIKKIGGKLGKHLIITKNGRAEAVLMSPEELETLEIQSNPELMRDILRGLEDIKAGRIHSHAEVFKPKNV